MPKLCTQLLLTSSYLVAMKAQFSGHFLAATISCFTWSFLINKNRMLQAYSCTHNVMSHGTCPGSECNIFVSLYNCVCLLICVMIRTVKSKTNHIWSSPTQLCPATAMPWFFAMIRPNGRCRYSLNLTTTWQSQFEPVPIPLNSRRMLLRRSSQSAQHCSQCKQYSSVAESYLHHT